MPITPDQIAKAGTEHAHQAAFFCWINQEGVDRDRRLQYTFAIPNGGERNVKVASRLKAEGVKPGVPDVFVPIPCGQYHGLWIEFKKLGKGRMRSSQKEFEEYLQSQGYKHKVAFTYIEAISYVLHYLTNLEKK